MRRKLLIAATAVVFAAASWLTIQPAIGKHQQAAERRATVKGPTSDIAAVPGDAAPGGEATPAAPPSGNAATAVRPASSAPTGPVGTVR